MAFKLNDWQCVEFQAIRCQMIGTNYPTESEGELIRSELDSEQQYTKIGTMSE